MEKNKRIKKGQIQKKLLKEKQKTKKKRNQGKIKKEDIIIKRQYNLIKFLNNIFMELHFFNIVVEKLIKKVNPLKKIVMEINKKIVMKKKRE